MIYYHDLNQAIKVTESAFLFINVFLLFVVHNCKNESIDVTKNDFF